MDFLSYSTQFLSPPCSTAHQLQNYMMSLMLHISAWSVMTPPTYLH